MLIFNVTYLKIKTLYLKIYASWNFAWTKYMFNFLLWPGMEENGGISESFGYFERHTLQL